MQPQNVVESLGHFPPARIAHINAEMCIGMHDSQLASPMTLLLASALISHDSARPCSVCCPSLLAYSR